MLYWLRFILESQVSKAKKTRARCTGECIEKEKWCMKCFEEHIDYSVSQEVFDMTRDLYEGLNSLIKSGVTPKTHKESWNFFSHALCHASWSHPLLVGLMMLIAEEGHLSPLASTRLMSCYGRSQKGIEEARKRTFL